MKTADVKSIMLIDDDGTFNFINESIIQSALFTNKIITYQRPDEALEELKEIGSSDKSKFPEMIFLDINMPDMDGWEFLDEYEKLPESLRDYCRVVMLTSSINDEDMVKASKHSIQDFISKPLTQDKLVLLMDGMTAIS